MSASRQKGVKKVLQERAGVNSSVKQNMAKQAGVGAKEKKKKHLLT